MCGCRHRGQLATPHTRTLSLGGGEKGFPLERNAGSASVAKCQGQGCGGVSGERSGESQAAVSEKSARATLKAWVMHADLSPPRPQSACCREQEVPGAARFPGLCFRRSREGLTEANTFFLLA